MGDRTKNLKFKVVCPNCTISPDCKIGLPMVWDYKAQYWICFGCGSYIDETTFVSKSGYFVGHTEQLGMIKKWLNIKI